MEEPMLYSLYNRIKERNIAGGPTLSEYYLSLQLLTSPASRQFTMEDWAFALETLWLKSHNDQALFRQILAESRTALLEFASQIATDHIQQVNASAGQEQRHQQERHEEKSSDAPPKEQLNVESQPATNAKENDQNTPLVTDRSGGLPGEDTSVLSFSFGFPSTSGQRSLNVNYKPETVMKTKTELPYLFTNDYHPVKNRQLQQTWRSLSIRKKGSELSEVDLSQTIKDVARTGYLFRIFNKRDISNEIHLFVFLDQNQSMAAWEEFGQELCLTAAQSKAQNDFTPWFFNGTPIFNYEKGEYVLTNNDCTKTIDTQRLFSRYNKKNIVILVYSDAGALTGSCDDSRIENMKKFIRHLQKKSSYIAWLNPTPKKRWEETGVAEILKEVHMFEAHRAGIENAANVLKGKIKGN